MVEQYSELFCLYLLLMYPELFTLPISQPTVDEAFYQIERYDALDGGAFLYQCKFDIAKFDLEVAARLNIAVPESIRQSVKKRQAEFIAGRYMAQLCLKAFSITGYDVGIGSHREPLWPVELVGAISHTHHQAAALVAKRAQYNFVGLDIENQLDIEMAKQIGGYIYDECEFALLSQQGLSAPLITLIIFSAKESLFKATFPYVGRYFGFESARIIEINVREQSLVLEIEGALSRYCADQHTFKCRYFFGTSGVTTVLLS